MKRGTSWISYTREMSMPTSGLLRLNSFCLLKLKCYLLEGNMNRFLIWSPRMTAFCMKLFRNRVCTTREAGANLPNKNGCYLFGNLQVIPSGGNGSRIFFALICFNLHSWLEVFSKSCKLIHFCTWGRCNKRQKIKNWCCHCFGNGIILFIVILYLSWLVVTKNSFFSRILYFISKLSSPIG